MPTRAERLVATDAEIALIESAQAYLAEHGHVGATQVDGLADTYRDPASWQARLIYLRRHRRALWRGPRMGIIRVGGP